MASIGRVHLHYKYGFITSSSDIDNSSITLSRTGLGMWFTMQSFFLVATIIPLLFPLQSRAVEVNGEDEDEIVKALDIDNIFFVSRGDQPANCDAWKAQVKNWYKESFQLANAALECIELARGEQELMIDGFDMRTAASDFMKAYFDLTDTSPPAEWDFVQGVSIFHCNYIELVERTADARDPQGNPIPKPGDDPGEYQTVEEEYAEKLLNKDGTSNGKFPYWSAINGHYYFGKNPDDFLFCDPDAEAKGGTQDSDPPPFLVLLCPANILATYRNGWETETLGEGPRPFEAQDFRFHMPKSATLYHEAFHLVMHGEDTPDVTYWLPHFWVAMGKDMKDTRPTYQDPYYPEGDPRPNADPQTLNTQKWTFREMMWRNPETYAWFATAWWNFARKTYVNEDGKRWKAKFTAGTAEIMHENSPSA
ncbi:hypothetical protein MPH_02976 [Macrophomina phaseolina MS6]|uniref:Uncharacterized protein n=1 Tax=Macrophomina phaseolina (strain MS6) TaxID=1126212 RepID=K2SBF7_MACPH|nr:hypothetical protein MPH_02976 [Macrophomina phaseolina MS6]